MIDRPAIFSGPMVRALHDDRKTQTRRLATSPLRHAVVGDRLYVREAWLTWGVFDDLKPSLLTGNEGITYLADIDHDDPLPGRKRPGMHMPRWASRLTLIVEGVRVEQLQAISEADSIAEGLVAYRLDGLPGHEFNAWHWLTNMEPEDTYTSGRAAYRALWRSLHTKDGQRWEDNPDVVVLTFRVVRHNIDRIAT